MARELRKAQEKIFAFEDHLIEGLAECSDARAALRMHLFNATADPDLPLQRQLSNRLAGTAIGELLGQRFEHLESPDFHPALLGAAAAFPPGYGGPVPALPFLVPAAEAAEELAIDNVILGQWLGVVPAMLRNATGTKVWGGAVVGVPEAYDEALAGMLASLVANPTTQLMLTLVAMARYAWAAMRKEAPPPPKTGGLKESEAKEAAAKANATLRSSPTGARDADAGTAEEDPDVGAAASHACRRGHAQGLRACGPIGDRAQGGAAGARD